MEAVEVPGPGTLTSSRILHVKGAGVGAVKGVNVAEGRPNG